jgi:hypothetical protein
MLPQPTRDEIKLRRENARLKERIKALEETLGVGEDEVATLQLVFGLKRKAAQIFAIIKRRPGVISKDVIYHILYGGLPECEQPTLKTIEVHMVAIRAALWTHGIVIRTVAVGGYVLDAGRARQARDADGRVSGISGSDHVGDALTLRAAAAGCAVGCRRWLRTLATCSRLR